jgi:hypothetical protein
MFFSGELVYVCQAHEGRPFSNTIPILAYLLSEADSPDRRGYPAFWCASSSLSLLASRGHRCLSSFFLYGLRPSLGFLGFKFSNPGLSMYDGP